MDWIMQQLNSFRNYDWPLIIVIGILAMIGLTGIYSVDLSRGDELLYFPTQSLAFVIGVVVLFTAASFHLTLYQSGAKLIYLSAFLLLLGVLFFGETIRGTTGWFRVAGVSFQPVEFAKIGLILFLAWWITRHGRRFHTWQFVLTSGGLTALLVGLVLLQPDLGSALVLGAIWLGLLFFTGIKKRYLMILLGSGLIMVIIAWFLVLEEYQKDRFFTFLDPGSPERALTTGYNVNQSLIAVGAGGFFGRGLGFGSQSQLRFLPEAQTDFIFSVIAEELGFFGVLMVVLLYGILFWRLIRIAVGSEDEFAAYTVLGITLLFFIQMAVNIGATINLLPVTGVTLPFVSYGGSSFVVNCFLVGIVQSVAVARLQHDPGGLFQT